MFLYDICSHILAYTKGATCICTASAELRALQKAFKEAGGHWSTFIIWAKNHFTLGRADYQRQYEAILYGWKEGNERKWYAVKVIYDKPTCNTLHPTMKPLELIEKAIINSSNPGDLIPSLALLIACERRERMY